MPKPQTPKPIKGNPKDNNLVGTELDDVILGLGGNDTLSGLGGNDTLNGGIGADSLDGGAGSDFASYQDATAGLTADLAAPGNNTGEAAGDTYISIEHLRGSAFDDILTGNGGNNLLRGGGGADALNGGAGFDTADYFNTSSGLIVDLGNPSNNTGEAIGDSYTSIENLRGSAFDDTLRGDAGNNLLDGQVGADVLDGAGGFDFAWYNSATSGVTASLANSAANTGQAAGDTYISIEGLVGSSFDDTLVGDNNINFLRGQLGGDTLNGQGGFDWADYINATSAVTVDLSNPGNNTGEAAGDTFIAIEGIRGSTHNDTLVGDAVLNGGTALNQFDGGLGADTLIGNGGVGNYAVYRNSPIGLTVNLSNPGSNTGEAAGDSYTGINSIVGSAFSDTLTGNADNNWLVGGAGADALDGQGGDRDAAAYWNATGGLTASLANPASNNGDAAGDSYTGIEGLVGSQFDDILTGDSGDNFLVGTIGADELHGGLGSDTASYTIFTATVGIVADLANSAENTGEAAGDTYDSIENLTGTNFNDSLFGDNNNNVLRGSRDGGAGNDTLVGRGGADTLDGGAGTDTANYNDDPAGISVTFTGDTAGTVIDGYGGTDTFTNVELVFGSQFNDTFTSGGSNVFIGLQGDDVFNGVGGDGLDVVDYSFDAQFGAPVNVGVRVNQHASEIQGGLDPDTAIDSFGDTDSIAGVRNVIGTQYADEIYGGTNGNRIEAGAENDLIFGHDGDDRLFGQGGDDTIGGGVGADRLIGGSGNDTLTGGSDADTFVWTTGGGTDTVTSWEDGSDLLEFNGVAGIDDFSDLTVTDNGANAEVRFGSDLLIVVVGAQGQIDATDFQFA
jgi:Ca2+-binding RTX toxin-like protein